MADAWGPNNVLIPSVFAAAILLFGWLGISTWQGFVVFAVLYGFFSGTLVSLPPACVAALTDPSEMSKLGTRMGMVFRFYGFVLTSANDSILSISTLTGTPIAGGLISNDNEEYTRATIFSGVVMFVAGLFLVASRIAKVGIKIRVRA